MAQWIYFIGGRGKTGKIVAVAIGMSPNPEGKLASLAGNQPFRVELLGLEKGSQTRLEQLREKFAKAKLNGPWFRGEDALVSYIEALPPVDREAARPRRVSLDLSAEDFIELEGMVSEASAVTKQRFLRAAYKSFGRLVRFQARGYKIQAIKGGKLVQFDDLLKIPDP